MDESRAISAFEAATEKQLMALDLAAEGLISKQIAIRLDISPRSVNQRIDAIRAKAGYMTRADLVRIYRRWEGPRDRVTCNPIPVTPLGAFEPEQESSKETEMFFEDSFAFDGRASWDRIGDWRRPGFRPSDLGAWGKGAAVLFVAVLLLVSFSLIVATAEGINSIAASTSGG